MTEGGIEESKTDGDSAAAEMRICLLFCEACSTACSSEWVQHCGTTLPLNVMTPESLFGFALLTGFVWVRENWKSPGKIRKPFLVAVAGKSGNIDYSPTVRESQGI